MLSAIAARKAAQAASARQDTKQTAAARSPSTASEHTRVPTVAKSISNTSVVEQPPRKRRRKNTSDVGGKRTRYFEKEDLGTNVIDVNDAGNSVAHSSSDDDERPSALFVEGQISRHVKSRRMWSPSRPQTASEDETDDNTLPPKEPSLSTVQEPQSKGPLSTFRPLLNKNMFHLAPEEREMIGLPSLSATILLLSPADNFSITGTCSMTVFAGSVSLCGVTLSASRTQHAIFAPKSSPVPVVEYTDSPQESISIFPLPDRIRRLCNPMHAVVAIQELQSGVEGLGRVCRTFEGVFDSPLGQPEFEHDLGVRSITRIF